jgi:LacI family transcriptional regulator
MSSDEAAAAFVRERLEGPAGPTALITFDPAHAYGALAALESSGLSVPGDMSLICRAGDPVPAGRRPLTTIPVDIKEMGRIAARLVDMRLEGGAAGPMHIAMPSPLVDRNTVAAPVS